MNRITGIPATALALALLAGCQGSDGAIGPSTPADLAAAGSQAGLKPPSGLSAAALSATEISLVWQDNATSETGFEIHRSTSGASGPFALIGTTGANVRSYTDAGLVATSLACYKVRAIKVSSGRTSHSAFSNSACATTLTPPPPAKIYGVWAEETSAAAVTVTWRDGSTDEGGFRIERATHPDGPWALAGTVGSNVTTWITNQADYYRVRAFNVSGDGWPSDPAYTYPAAPTDLALTVIAPGTVEITWSDNSAFEDAFEVWLGSPSWCCPDSGGCDAGYYENPYDEVLANITRYRTELASNECQSYTLIVMARRGGALSNAAYVEVP
ncbi:MAG TPA: fibronectin type III domain-containing protein [Gemmatimonadales bacterium]|nr:fibronectin type III domain-containing protein [Gemmatimonadales bacterium]